MATQEWEAFLSEVTPQCAGVPYVTAENALRNAAVEFCQKSTIWRLPLTAVDVAVDTQEYDLSANASLPSYGQIVVPTYVEFDGTAIAALSSDQADAISPQWRESQIPMRYHMIEPHTLFLTWKPDAAVTGGLKIRVALKPTPTANEMEDWVYNDWREQIALGAIARLREIPNQPWSNYDRAQGDRNRFRGFIDQARGQADKGRTKVSSRVKLRGGWARGDTRGF